jgi:hypothetical protein
MRWPATRGVHRTGAGGVGFPVIDGASTHDCQQHLGRFDLLRGYAQGIAVDDDEIRELADLKRADGLVIVQLVSRIARDRLDDLGRR